MMRWYAGNETGQIPGAFPTKWWEGSALFLALLQYWHFTGDTQYNDELSQGLQWQSGDNGNYMPTNYSSYLVSTQEHRYTSPKNCFLTAFGTI
jgi:mannan endo-1,6-alpha-mannosidase